MDYVCIGIAKKLRFLLLLFPRTTFLGRWKWSLGNHGNHGWPEAANKFKTWELLRQLCGDYEGPVLSGGDFNEILDYEEKEGGSNLERRAIPEF